MKLISIITINYNNANGLQKTIKSVVDQSFQDFEYIIIDGGSTDGSKQIIENNQSKIAYWVSEKDKGIYNAMNKGIQQATGKYLLFLNSGDYLCDGNVLANVVKTGITSDIAYGNMLIEKEDGSVEQGYMPSKITFKQMILDTLWHPVSFMKKDLFDKYGLYNEQIKIVSDYDFFFKTIIMNSVSTQYLNLNISVYNLNGLSSLLENKATEQAERKKVLTNYLPEKIVEFIEDYRNLSHPKTTKWQRLIKKLKK